MAIYLSEYIVETAETYLGDVMGHLNWLGAWIEELESHDGVLRLRFRAPGANMHGFEEWLRHATKGTGKVYRNLH